MESVNCFHRMEQQFISINGFEKENGEPWICIYYLRCEQLIQVNFMIFFYFMESISIYGIWVQIINALDNYSY
jgi:hypothetical protein